MSKNRVILVVSVLAVVSLCLWIFSRATESIAPQQQAQTVEVTTKQLRDQNGFVLVEIKCNPAVLSSASTIQSFTCVMKNNSAKSVTAGSATYSILYDQYGKTDSASYVSIIETRLSPDFAGTTNAISPGGESGSLGPPGPMSIENSTIRGITIVLDFVEFDDGATIQTADDRGAKTIRSMRRGAEKYRVWLRTKYKNSGRSIRTAAALLENPDLPEDANLSADDERDGAKAYRSRLRKIRQVNGDSELVNILSRDND